ncbi:MAG: DUF2079 domain-containing protein [Candidatus Bathyarchaeia archaeon]
MMIKEKLKFLEERSLLRLRISDWLVIIMTIIYSLVFFHYTILKHYSFRSNAWDLGILVQSIASASQGKLFTNNVELYYSPTGSYFGVHFSPVLFLVVPFFSIAPCVETILILQSIILAAGAIPVYLIAKYILKDELTALSLSASYLLNPLLQGINWYDFHTQAFFPLLIISATYYLKRRRTIPYIFYLILSLSTVEQTAYFMILYALYSLWEMRKEIWGGERKRPGLRGVMEHLLIPLVTLTTAVLWTIISSEIKSIINPNPPPEIKAARAYKYLNISDPAEIPSRLLFHPDLALNAFQYDMPRKILYIILTFAPSCFIALLSPVALLPAFLWLLLASLSNWRPYYSLGFQYTAFTLPFVYIATIEALQKIHSRNSNKRITKKISTIILLVGIFLSLFLSPLSFVHRVGDYEYFRDYGISIPSLMNEQVTRIIAEIPKESTILTTQTIFPHLSTNLNVYTIPPINHPSQKLFESHIDYLKSNVKFDYILITSYWDKRNAELIYEEFIESSDEYGLLIKAPGLELYQRGYEGPPRKVAIKITYRELYPVNSVIIDDPTSESGKVIMFRASQYSGKNAWYGPYITLLPGNYIVRFRIKVDRLVDGRIIDLDVYSGYEGRISIYSVYGEYISKPCAWQTFTIPLSISERLKNVEFRGINVASNITVYLDYIEIIPE